MNVQESVKDETSEIASPPFRSDTVHFSLDSLPIAKSQRERIAGLKGVIAEKESNITSEKHNLLWYIPVIIIFLLVGIVLYINQISGWPIILFWIIFIITIFNYIGTIDTIVKSKGEIEKFKAQLEISTDLSTSSSTGSESYFQNLVTINVTNLREYYFLVKEHTNSAFRTALCCGALGFGLVCIGLTANAIGSVPESFSYISASAGIITEFISAVFFYLYNRTVRQLKEYHDSLLDVQNVLLSLKLLETVEDGEMKAPMIMNMLDYLLENKKIKVGNNQNPKSTQT